MRTRHYLEALSANPERLVAYFGSAQLVRTQRGRLEVRGGTDVDQADARQWVARFLTPPPGVACCRPLSGSLSTRGKRG